MRTRSRRSAALWSARPFSLFLFQNRIGGTLLRGRTFEFKREYRFNRKSWGQAFKSGWAK